MDLELDIIWQITTDYGIIWVYSICIYYKNNMNDLIWSNYMTSPLAPLKDAHAVTTLDFMPILLPDHCLFNVSQAYLLRRFLWPLLGPITTTPWYNWHNDIPTSPRNWRQAAGSSGASGGGNGSETSWSWSREIHMEKKWKNDMGKRTNEMVSVSSDGHLRNDRP